MKNTTSARCAALAFAAALLSACEQPSGAPGGSSPPAAMSHPVPQSAPVAMAAFDARFLDGMIPHHQMAVMMAREALIRADHAEIKQLAQAIIDSQQREIDTMTAWRRAWYPTLAPTGGMAAGMSHATAMNDPNGSGQMPGMSGMAHEAATSGSTAIGERSRIVDASASAGQDSSAKGPFDRDFIDEMIPHHQGAISMAKEALTEAEHAEVRQLATEIIEAQQREITQLTDWRRSWYGH